MRHLVGSRAGLVLALPLALAGMVAGACSRTPHFVPDQTGGSGDAGGAMTTTSSVATTSSTTGSGGAGAGAVCLNASDCNLPDTDCAHPACREGVCTRQFEPMGKVTAAQIPRDCHQNVCDGAGNVIAVNDDSDLPTDGNPCTADACLSGVPLHPFVAIGTQCGSKASMTCDAMGRCINCTAAAQCGMNGACFTWTCNGKNVCLQTFTPPGTGDPGGGAPGDCQKNVCDGKGFAVIAADPTDVPPSPNPCAPGACVNGVPGTTPAKSETPCLGSACDGEGHCGTCSADIDCGAPSSCVSPKCVGGHCSAIFAVAGTMTTEQVDGDCEQKVCDGEGNVILADDDDDAPPPTNACHSSACSGGKPTTASLPDGTGCGGCSICQGGICFDPCPSMGCQCFGQLCLDCP